MVAVVIVLVAFLFVSGTLTGNASASSDDVIIPLSEISQNAKWYEYEDGGVIISFFVVKAADGSVKTAFNGCDVCYGAKKGYSQQGDLMVCNNCGNKYPISGLGTENLKGGGCWPGYIPNEIEGENVVIKRSDILEGKYRFE